MNIEILKAQSDIMRLLNKDNGVTVHFEEDSWPANEEYELEVFTFNPAHGQPFLFYSTRTHNSLEKCYGELTNYVNNLVAVIGGCEADDDLKAFVGHSYTIEWADTANQKRVSSHFWAEDIDTALNKFYHSKERKDFTIMSINLNPDS